PAPTLTYARLAGSSVMPNPVSSANFFGHPIHPMLVLFPVAFFVATFVSDLGFWYSGNALWVTAALWLLGAGLVMAALAAIAGLVDFLGEARIRDISNAWQHAIGNVLAVLISFSFYWRYRHGAAGIIPAGLLMSLIVKPAGMMPAAPWR